MLIVNIKSYKKLEFDKIITRLAEHASSLPGKELCQSLLPSTNLDQVNKNLGDTSDALSRILRNGSISFGGLKDVRPFLKSLEIGSTLGITELLMIQSLLRITESSIKYGNTNSESAPDHLHSLFISLNPLREVSSQINRCIISESEIADDASSELKNIRRQIKNTNERIQNELSNMLTGSSRTYLQEAVITSRGGRYCVPVKAEYRSQVSGMIHDQSKGGSTFFIEPMSVVKLNNDLHELDIKESDEIARILAMLSELAGNYVPEISQNFSALCQLDFIFAKAKLSLSYKGSEPLMNTEHYIEIKKGRHPLIDSHKVIPIDVVLGDSYQQLIITGPNTGGKTVTLKTLGLFTLMAQSGLHIPAFEHSKLSIFQNVFADIGDEQSIEQSLSTFSSHMKNIVTILKYADSDSLVLFDELCAGTDPTEGAALAISILTSLRKLKVTTAATTHYSELKIYALSTPEVENASCEFDLATLAPTYRLIIGIPGKSNAFAISGKLGLPSHIIDDARLSINQQDQSFEEVISELEASRLTIEKERNEIQKHKLEIKSLNESLKAKQDRLEERANDIIEKANAQASAILKEAKETTDEAIRKLNKANASGMTVAQMETQRRLLKEKMDKTASKKKTKTSAPSKSHDFKDFHIGDTVFVHSLNLNGTVHTLPNQKGELTVSMGILHSQVHIRDLEIIQEKNYEDKLRNKSSSLGKLKMNKAASMSSEINLIGMTKDEAIMNLDKYLDDAFLTHISPIRIVHGKGSGVLRNAVWDYLRSQKHVKSYRQGAFGEGDYGVTIIEFK